MRDKIPEKALSNVLENLRCNFGINEKFNVIIKKTRQGYRLNRDVAKIYYKKIYDELKSKSFMDNYEFKSPMNREQLRYLQLNMLQTLEQTDTCKETEDLLPYYFEPSDILLFYNVSNMELGLFFNAKYDHTWDGKRIQADIVKVNFGLFGECGKIAEYNTSIDYYTDRTYFEFTNHLNSCIRKSKTLPDFIGSWDYSEMKSNDENQLFPNMIDYDTYGEPKIKYLEKGITYNKVILDLATVYSCYLLN